MLDRIVTLPRFERRPDGSCIICCKDPDGGEFSIPFANVFEAWRFEDILIALTPIIAAPTQPSAEMQVPAGRTRKAKCGHDIPSHPGHQRLSCGVCPHPKGKASIPTPRVLQTEDLICAGCGNAFVQMRSGPKAARPTCSSSCRTWVRSGNAGLLVLGACLHCQAPLDRQGKKYCTEICGERARGQRLPVPLPLLRCALAECEVEFQPKSRRQTCCCEKHGKLHSHRMYRAAGKEVREPWGDQRREAYHRRRALKKNASTGDPVRFTEIAERDQWMCGICSTPVDASLVWPDPMSPSLDHVIPLTKGGAHDPSNVNLAHLRCNTIKNARHPDDPLLAVIRLQ